MYLIRQKQAVALVEYALIAINHVANGSLLHRQLKLARFKAQAPVELALPGHWVRPPPAQRQGGEDAQRLRGSLHY